jgi:putative transposase
MYEFRKLTPTEKEELLRYRLQQGYPLHAPPHPHRGEGTFIITAATFEHRHLLSTSERRTNFELALIKTFCDLEMELIAWVVLPNHYHVLMNAQKIEGVSGGLKRLHGRTSREWNQLDDANQRRVWYKYSDRKIRGERHYYATLNYIHHNPVKHGYVSLEQDWPWSSWRLYAQDYGSEWLREKREQYPVLDYGAGWDK